jgi:hypothetical protein
MSQHSGDAASGIRELISSALQHEPTLEAERASSGAADTVARPRAKRLPRVLPWRDAPAGPSGRFPELVEILLGDQACSAAGLQLGYRVPIGAECPEVVGSGSVELLGGYHLTTILGRWFSDVEDKLVPHQATFAMSYNATLGRWLACDAG